MCGGRGEGCVRGKVGRGVWEEGGRKGGIFLYQNWHIMETISGQHTNDAWVGHIFVTILGQNSTYSKMHAADCII